MRIKYSVPMVAIYMLLGIWGAEKVIYLYIILFFAMSSMTV
jgi:hypothetical protein